MNSNDFRFTGKLPEGAEGRVKWRSPSNIALVKYWGKQGNQLPANPSISMTLRESYTETEIHYKVRAENEVKWKFFFEGKKQPSFNAKINAFFDRIRSWLPCIDQLEMQVYSKNTFPHSSGIASSASAMSALALGVLSIASENVEGDKLLDFFRRASYLARLGSGSASRSVYGGYVSWGEIAGLENSSSLYASPLPIKVNSYFENLNDAILIVSSERKKVSSSAGHDMMKDHWFADGRIQQAGHNTKKLMEVLQKGEKENFINIIENEALTLHSLMMSSQPGFILFESASLQIIRSIEAFREKSGLFMAYTLDAGPNVHLLYHDDDKKEVERFIQNKLLPYCENHMIIRDHIGHGPTKI